MKLFRPFLIAVAALAISAAAAFATQTPGAASDGLSTASQASGRTVPAIEALPSQVPPAAQQHANGSADVQAATEEDAQDGTEAGCAATTDETAMTDETAQTDAATHGDAVCTVATSETPDGYANHGAFVSETARDNAGADASAAAGANGAANAQGASANASAGLDTAANAGANVDAAGAALEAAANATANAGVDLQIGRP
jgi:hypothetical protein